MSVEIIQGDALLALKTIPDDTFHACVTDPPYHFGSIVKRFAKSGGGDLPESRVGAYSRHARGFMGKEWDGGTVALEPETWAAVLRTLKPGAHLAAFGGTKTFHRMACAIEDAGFELRDTLMWVYGSGFPKSHNQHGEWEGWGTALKPAWEPIVLARKPLVGTVAANIAKHGVGAINVDGCRVEGEPWKAHRATGLASEKFFTKGEAAVINKTPHAMGRWPANLLHDGSDEVVEAFPVAPGQQGRAKQDDTAKTNTIYGKFARNETTHPEPRDDEGSAARFFYCAKASKSDRGDGNTHPTVKPRALMRWLCRLVTPPAGTILDPFNGSGSTGLAAMDEGFSYVGIEKEAEYVEIARRRLGLDAMSETESMLA